MTPSPALLERIAAIAEDAGRVILRHYRTGVAVERKADSSPVTAADRDSEALIAAALAALDPETPVIAGAAVAAGLCNDHRRFEMSSRASVTLTLTLAFAAAATAAAQAPELPDVDRFGPQVGETVPSFSLVDQHGAARDLQSLTGPRGLMLVFSRSADW